MVLSKEHPDLDKFKGEITVKNGRLLAQRKGPW
jgi:hypothetical protein